MKIALLSTANNTHTKRWVQALANQGLSILLFSLTDADDFYNKLPNVKVITGMSGFQKKRINKLNYLKILPKLKRSLKEFNPDIIHAHYASSYGLLGALAKTNIPYVISVWGSDVYEFPKTIPFGKYILSYNLSKADYILSTSHVMAKETSKYTDKEILITPFGVDTERFKKKEGLQPTSEFIVGNVKTLAPIYGIDTLIKAYKILVDRNPNLKTRLLIYGKGPYRKEYENLAKSLNIYDLVEFKGFMENEKLPDVYNSISVAVSTSNSESFGVVAVEAMACECPVVTSDAEGFTEVVKDGETGFIVPKRDPQTTARVIQKFIDNPSLREEMGRAGRERVKSLYNWNDNVNTMIDIYNKIVLK